MAVTGRGTRTNPWIVSTYEELKEYCAKQRDDDSSSDTSDVFIKLKDDTVIDCNKYGASWEWETISCSSVGGANITRVDLNGGTIKNAVIKADNYLFLNEATGTAVRVFEIQNGKLLNIFSNRAKAFIDGKGGMVHIENVSMSVNITSTLSAPFAYFSMINSSIFVKGQSFIGGTNQLFFMRKGQVMQNCDVKVEIENAGGYGTVFTCGENYGVVDCRIRGYINNPKSASCIADARVQNCVIAVDVPSGTSRLVSDYSTGVYDKTKAPVTYNSGMVAASSTEIKDHAWLNANGFNCAKED